MSVWLQLLQSVGMPVSTMVASVLVVMRMLIRAMRVFVCVLMVVDVTMLVCVFMDMCHSVVRVLMRMSVAVDVFMRMIVFVFALHVHLPKAC
jgi:hypothetical protein